MHNELKLPSTEPQIPEGLALVTLGGGCFWCVEAIFKLLNGVELVILGYSGGFVDNPTYEEVSRGTTGHAEVIQIYYNPFIISFSQILEVFWDVHDPTSLNKQGADEGPHYRSVIFYHNPDQGRVAQSLKEQLNESKVFDSPIVTEISAFSNFYPAENYHQDYYNQNGAQPYCQLVIKPKVDKLKKFFAGRLK